MNDAEIRQYMSEMSKKRKVFKGGFNSPEVQEKIRKIKREKKLAKQKEQESKSQS